MKGKVCVITGATSGIGLVAAGRLAALGARLVLVGRDEARGRETLANLGATAPGSEVRIVYGDLSRLSEIKRVGAEIAASEPKIDVLINNAGAMFTTRQTTEDGLERTFAVNHMAYFTLTQTLLTNLKKAAPSRIVNTASDAHRGQQLDFSDLQAAKHYSGFAVYGRSKLANILFTRELARRISGSGVTANCLHPGFVATRFGDNNGGMMRIGISLAKLVAAVKPETGAETIVYLASSPEVATVSGLYFYKCRPGTPTAAAQDDDAARRLWDVSENIAGLVPA
jgi:NAD(P)-dependent dehydrogenase (short-subunit alcohol dehydrogenase family)